MITRGPRAIYLFLTCLWHAILTFAILTNVQTGAIQTPTYSTMLWISCSVAMLHVIWVMLYQARATKISVLWAMISCWLPTLWALYVTPEFITAFTRNSEIDIVILLFLIPVILMGALMIHSDSIWEAIWP